MYIQKSNKRIINLFAVFMLICLIVVPAFLDNNVKAETASLAKTYNKGSKYYWNPNSQRTVVFGSVTFYLVAYINNATELSLDIWNTNSYAQVTTLNITKTISTSDYTGSYLRTITGKYNDTYVFASCIGFHSATANSKIYTFIYNPFNNNLVYGITGEYEGGANPQSYVDYAVSNPVFKMSDQESAWAYIKTGKDANSENEIYIVNGIGQVLASDGKTWHTTNQAYYKVEQFCLTYDSSYDMFYGFALTNYDAGNQGYGLMYSGNPSNSTIKIYEKSVGGVVNRWKIYNDNYFHMIQITENTLLTLYTSSGQFQTISWVSCYVDNNLFTQKISFYTNSLNLGTFDYISTIWVQTEETAWVSGNYNGYGNYWSKYWDILCYTSYSPYAYQSVFYNDTSHVISTQEIFLNHSPYYPCYMVPSGFWFLKIDTMQYELYTGSSLSEYSQTVTPPVQTTTTGTTPTATLPTDTTTTRSIYDDARWGVGLAISLMVPLAMLFLPALILGAELQSSMGAIVGLIIGFVMAVVSGIFPSWLVIFIVFAMFLFFVARWEGRRNERSRGMED